MLRSTAPLCRRGPSGRRPRQTAIDTGECPAPIRARRRTCVGGRSGRFADREAELWVRVEALPRCIPKSSLEKAELLRAVSLGSFPLGMQTFHILLNSDDAAQS